MLNNFIWNPLTVVVATFGVWSAFFWRGSARFQELAMTHLEVARTFSAWSSSWNLLGADFAVVSAVIGVILALVALMKASSTIR